MREMLGVLVAIACGLAASRACAAPPTVTPSPGYDARLQEERARMQARPAMPPQSPPLAPHREHHHARGYHRPR